MAFNDVRLSQDLSLEAPRSANERGGQSAVADFNVTVDTRICITANEHCLDKGVVSHEFKAGVRPAGLSEGLHFHSLRHTFASWLVQEGVSIYEVQKLIGHTSVAMTQIYSHLAPGGLFNAVNKLAVIAN